ncbi:MliC family protein [Nitratireductor soli]|uniref:MliC family protein n=1 Tax=Nitratireductor soli TaxID=1670619 RepID=UPI00065E8124|nr:MliC family protein [Nitratireductor soli]
MRRFLPILVTMLLAAPGVHAATVELDLPYVSAVEADSVTYRCPDFELTATYHNAGDIALAVLQFEARNVVVVTVPSASGARYAGGNFVWWTKGDHGDLYDVSRGEDAKPVSCAAGR